MLEAELRNRTSLTSSTRLSETIERNVSEKHERLQVEPPACLPACRQTNMPCAPPAGAGDRERLQDAYSRKCSECQLLLEKLGRAETKCRQIFSMSQADMLPTTACAHVPPWVGDSVSNVRGVGDSVSNVRIRVWLRHIRTCCLDRIQSQKVRRLRRN